MSLALKLARLADLFGGNQNGFGVPLSNRNYIVDGNFDSWVALSQVLGVGGNSNNAATMYHCLAGTSGNATVSQGLFNGTDPAGMTSPARYYMQFQQTVASTGTLAALTSPMILQNMESVETLQGRTATFSCWLWVPSGTMSITQLTFSQAFGTGGSPSASVSTVVPVSWNLTTTPQRFSVSVNLPSTSGKTLGTTAGTDFLQVVLQLPPGSTYTVNTAQWQLEQSNPDASTAGVPTAFEYRGIQAELARISRQYQVFTAAQFAGYAPSAIAVTTACITFTQMRANPGVALSAQSFSNASALSATAVSSGVIETFVTASAAGGFWAVASLTLDARL
jgi:hypothetical protein